MSLRRILPVALAAAALAACEPSLPAAQRTNPSTIDYVVFDPANSQIPLPNDLALQPTSVAAATGAQKEILQQFLAAGGFPNDQEVPILIDVQRLDTGSGAKTPPAEAIDLTTINAGPGGNLIVLKQSAGSATPTPVCTTPTCSALRFNPVSGVYAADRATLEIHNAQPDATTGSLAWEPGAKFIVVLRGGPSGVKLTGGGVLNAQQTMFLLTRGVNLADPANQTTATRGQIGLQLEQLRQAFLPLFGIAEQTWGAGASQEIAVAQAFTVAPKAPGTAVLLDASAAKAIPPIPIPSDLLLNPATNTVVNNPAFCLGNLDATGSCALAAGLATLDGFSTTALAVSGTNAPLTPASGAPLPIAVATVNQNTVFLYDLSSPATPARVKEVNEGAGAGFLAEPPQLGKTATTGATCTATDVAQGNCFSTVIGLQPAVPIPLPTGGVLSLPPLKEKTEYAVLVTDGVKDASGAALTRSSLSSILLLDQPLVDPAGKSQIGGQPDVVAGGLELIRQGVAAAAAALQAEKSITKDHVVLGYTFRTQSVTDVSLKIAALPSATPAAFVPGTPSPNLAAALPVPVPAAQEIVAVPLVTLNAIDPQTGAFRPDTTQWKLSSAADPQNPLLTALVVVPPALTGTPAAPRAAPLVVFQHGITRTKLDVLAIANTLATAGFVTVAFDEPLHGDRSLCTSLADCTCTGALGPCTTPTCDTFATFGGAALGAPLGLCGGGSTIVAAQSGAFAISANPFLMRDGLRQDLIDAAAVIQAVAPTTPSSTALSTRLAADGIAVDPTKVYIIGQSLGAIVSSMNLAVNPRISRGVLNVPGATIADIITQSPSISPRVNALLTAPPPAGLGIPLGSPQFLLFLNVLKWVVDPGEAINYAGHILGDTAHPTLPSPLTSNQPQPAKNVFGQYAICDQVIPNPFNLLLFGNIGLQSNAGPNAFTSYTVTGAGTPPAACTAAATNPAHGFLLSPTADPATTGQGQLDLAAYLTDLTVPTADRP